MKGVKGFQPLENNPMWKGDDAADQTGRDRASRWFIVSRFCEKCNRKIHIERHHKDGNSLNNDRQNLQFLCRRCHMEEDGRMQQFNSLIRKRDEKGRFMKDPYPSKARQKIGQNLGLSQSTGLRKTP